MQEGKSWGKVHECAFGDGCKVYADAIIAFPILAQYVISGQEKRKPKRLYPKLGKMYEKLKEDYFKKPDKYYDILDENYSKKG